MRIVYRFLIKKKVRPSRHLYVTLYFWRCREIFLINFGYIWDSVDPPATSMLVCRGVGGKENYQKKVFLEWEKKKVANVWVVE